MIYNKAFWWVALLVNMGIGTYWHVCHIEELCDSSLVSAPITSAQPSSTSPSASRPGLRITDGDQLKLTASGNFSFARSGADLSTDAVRTQADSLALYLKNHPDQHLTVTGLYTSDEANKTPFANLGLARAVALRGYLVQAGAPEGAIETRGTQRNELVFFNDSLYGGLNFEFLTLEQPAAATEQGLAEAEKFEDVFHTMDLYFRTGRTSYIETPANKQFVQEAKKYLGEHADKKLLLTGFTDSQGPDEVNLALSKKRAESVKSQFKRLGVPANQLITDGKGENEPKASNTAPAGRRANRRVSIVVQ